MPASPEPILEQIAREHPASYVKGDPIEVVHRLNQLLLSDFRKASDEQLTAMHSELEALYTRWDIEATQKSERILNASLNAAHARMNEAFDETSARFGGIVRSELAPVQSAVKAMIDEARTAAMWIAVSAFAVAAPIVAWGTWLMLAR